MGKEGTAIMSYGNHVYYRATKSKILQYQLIYHAVVCQKKAYQYLYLTIIICGLLNDCSLNKQCN